MAFLKNSTRFESLAEGGAGMRKTEAGYRNTLERPQ